MLRSLTIRAVADRPTAGTVAFSPVIDRVAAGVPAEVGLNATLTVQLLACTSIVPQVLLSIE